jgi:hypothetical protein
VTAVSLERVGFLAERRLVTAGGVDFYAEIVDLGGPTTIGPAEALTFDGVRQTLEGVAAELGAAWQKVRPAEATVEFGLTLTARSGKLTGLIVEGGGEASLKVTLTWRQPSSTP